MGCTWIVADPSLTPKCTRIGSLTSGRLHNRSWIFGPLTALAVYVNREFQMAKGYCW
jgi:hypothetical protein